MSSVIMQILEWPLTAINHAKGGQYLPLVAGVAASYWWAGGLPTQGQDMMTLAQAYVVGGVATVAVTSYSTQAAAM